MQITCFIFCLSMLTVKEQSLESLIYRLKIYGIHARKNAIVFRS